MSKRMIILGRDVSAYATLALPDDVSLDDEALQQFALSVEDDALFEVDWETESALRITSVTEDGVEGKPFTHGRRYLRQDVAVQPQYYDAGQQLQLLLNGQVTLADFINSLAVWKIIPPPQDVRYTGTLQLPMSESIKLEFYARKGASQIEKDAAFLAAFAQVGQISYEEAGDGED